MFSRATPLGRRGLNVPWDKVAPGASEEPLPFLYPQWAIFALRQRQSAATIRTATAPRRIRGSNLLFARRSSLSPPLPRCSRKLVSSSAALRKDPDQGDRQSTTTTQDDTPSTSSGAGDGTDTAEEMIKPPPGATLRLPSERASRKILNIFADIETPPTKTPQQSISTSLGRKTHLRPLAWTPPVSTPRKARHTIKKLSIRDRKKLRRLLYANETSGVKDGQSRLTQLAEIRKMLEEFEREPRVKTFKFSAQKQVLVPEETVALLAGVIETSLRDNIWYLPIHNGCRVHVLHPIESEGQFRKVILTGSRKVVEVVEERIKRLIERQASGDPLIDILASSVPVYPSMEAFHQKNQPRPLVRGCWDSRAHSRKLNVVLALKQLNTVRDFAEYIEDLTKSVPSDSPVSDRTHKKDVAKAIATEFKKEKNQRLISTAALNQALSFLYRHEFMNIARTILLKAEHVATVDTINIVLQGAAAKSLNLRVFRSILIAMRRLRIQPNEWTWQAFLECHVSGSARAKLATNLLQRGYLTTASLQTTLHLTIQDIFSAHLERGGDVDSFVNKVIYDVNWVGVPLINHMFAAIVARKDFSALERLLDICDEHNLPLRSSTINHVLVLVRKDLFSAIPIVLRVMARKKFALEYRTCERLFLLAYRTRAYNVCRVLWWYACMRKMVSTNMKEAVLGSLACVGDPQRTNKYTNIWERRAGKVIVGVGSDKTKYILQDPVVEELPEEYRKRPLLYLVNALRRDGTDTDLCERLATALVNRDIEVGPLYRPKLRLPVMLHAASVVDQEWGRLSEYPMNWLLQNTVEIPVKFKDLQQKPGETNWFDDN
ncbi:hypothetical protein PHISCL_08197 [Aspergillus sclerotialis]|uniref:Pentatricopeptide repeat protein n=1 Tax=Aspergillus sclerotialis TaxID=2070753 RepID=A0A3A2Z8M4_9EURO|nr:hypothetical protein PHISCL_08197 [Aspergillus sclerotialis]